MMLGSYRESYIKKKEDVDDESLLLHRVQIEAFWKLFSGAPRSAALPEMKRLQGDL